MFLSKRHKYWGLFLIEHLRPVYMEVGIQVRYHVAGHPTYHVNVIKLKSEIIWTGGLPHLSGVPHLYVNRPLE